MQVQQLNLPPYNPPFLLSTRMKLRSKDPTTTSKPYPTKIERSHKENYRADADIINESSKCPKPNVFLC